MQLSPDGCVRTERVVFTLNTASISSQGPDSSPTTAGEWHVGSCKTSKYRLLIVGALLVLLYGMHLTRIVAIERTQVDVGPAQVTLNIGKEPIELPDALGEAVTDLLKLSLHRSDRWLFVGRTPGEPLTAGALRGRLSRHGMQTGSARVTALLELAQQMHPRVLSDLLGISITSATAWWRLAGGDWAAYPALR